MIQAERGSGGSTPSLDPGESFGLRRPIAEILRDFRLLAKLGEGGMGVVYKAHQRSLDQEVALKILPPHLAQNPDFVQRFYREARMSVKLKHPNIVRGVAVGEEQGLHYFAMEFVEGHNLDHWLSRLGRLHVGDAVRVAIDVAQALDYAHSRSLPVFHRDVKPANIVITPDGEVKLLDLGLAKAAQDDGITQAGEMAGTPAYMAPEQARNAAFVDGRSDIYALGVTLYVLLTGKKPFTGRTPPEILEAKENGTFAPASSVNAEVPAEIDRILARMIVANFAKRYATAGEVAKDLVATHLANQRVLLSGADSVTLTISAPPQRAPVARQRWTWPRIAAVAAGATSLCVTLLVGAFAYSLRVEPPKPEIAVVAPIAPIPEPARVDPPEPIPAAPVVSRSTESVDLILAKAVDQLTSNDVQAANATLASGVVGQMAPLEIQRPLKELKEGTLVLFQFETPEELSPVKPIWVVDGVTLTRQDNYRFGVVPGRSCHVYVYQRDTRPSVTRIFPNPRYSPRSNPLPAGQLSWLPSVSKGDKPMWMHLDTSIGEERVYFLAVSKPLKNPDQIGKRLLEDAEGFRIAARQNLDSFLEGGGSPGEPCFAHEGEVMQVFRFDHR